VNHIYIETLNFSEEYNIMSEFNQQPSSEELRAAYLEDAMRPEGDLYVIAAGVLETTAELSADDVADILLPPKQPGASAEPRWQLIEGAPSAVKAGVASAELKIHNLANRLDMRRDRVLPADDLLRINPDAAIWVVEGGANRTSVVRRALTVAAMERVLGNETPHQAMYQLGSDRPIKKERADGSPSAEYVVAREIAGDFLPEDDSLTEFGLNVASALQAGYSRRDGHVPEGVQDVVYLEKEGQPQLILVKPVYEKGGLSDGFTAISRMGDMTGGQFVIATNGQYRPKDEFQANSWAAQTPELAMRPAVAVGDEPGFTIEHAGSVITTPTRPTMAYVNEAVILHRLNATQE
jgi:hypothetical protein